MAGVGGAFSDGVATYWLKEESFSVYNITGAIFQEKSDSLLYFICYKQL